MTGHGRACWCATTSLAAGAGPEQLRYIMFTHGAINQPGGPTTILFRFAARATIGRMLMAALSESGGETSRETNETAV